MFAPAVETRPLAEQTAFDAAHYRTQVAYLFDRSAFYQQKLKGAGFANAQAVGGLTDIAKIPFTEKADIRASCTVENPIGSHLCVERSEIIRIYSTSAASHSE